MSSNADSAENRLAGTTMANARPETVTAKLPNGALVRVAVPRPAIRGEEVSAREQVFDTERVRDALEGVGVLVSDAFNKIAPTKVSVELGFSFEIQSGHLTAVLVKGNVEADLKISLEWGAPRTKDEA
jgi:Trypsin-co-occurring domain 1